MQVFLLTLFQAGYKKISNLKNILWQCLLKTQFMGLQENL